MLKQIFDVGLFGIHVGYAVAKLELLHRIILGILSFGYWYSIVTLLSSIIAICVCDIKFDMLSNNDVLNCFVKPIFHYIKLISKIDDKIRNIVSKNRYSRMIDELEDKFSYWMMSILIRFIQYSFSQLRTNDAVTELLRSNQMINALLHIDHHVFIGDNPAHALTVAFTDLLRNPGGNADGVIHPENNNNNDIYRLFGLQHRHAPTHELVPEFIFGAEGIIRAAPAEGTNEHVPVNAEFRHEPNETDDESEDTTDPDDDPIIALTTEPPQELQESDDDLE